MDRLQNQLQNIKMPHGKESVLAQNDDDIVIVSAYRTAQCKARRGEFNKTSAVSLLKPVLQKMLETGIKPDAVNEIVVGTVLASGTLRHIECRMAGFLAGFPESTNVLTVNRQCSSGLQAIANVAAAIKAGYYEVGIAAGVESMSMDGKLDWNPQISDDIPKNKNARDCLIPMGITSENVTDKFGLTRKQLDEFSVQSHKKAFKAKEKFKEEIVPVNVMVTDPESGEKTLIAVTEDSGVRGDTSVELLSGLRAAFKENGCTTAGNSSQVSDGAAAALLMTRTKAKSLKLPIMGTFRNFIVKGVPPDIMGVGPLYAIPAALKQLGLTKEDIDLFEVNEAFASQAKYCVDTLKIPYGKVNVNGGAIALGHPLGCTGVRMTATLLHEMRRRGAKLGVVSMCIGTGMGAASVFTLD